MVRDEASLREPELLRTYAMRHDSGLHVLAAPAAPEAAETVTPAHVTQILRTLLEGYDMVVVDAGSTLDERALAIFEAAEQVILPITPEIGALKAMHALHRVPGRGRLGRAASRCSSSTTSSRARS